MCNSSVHASNAFILSSLKSPPNVVVCGGTGGIGRAIALSIAKHCPLANVTIIGRNESAANEVLSQLGSNSKFLRADASLMSEIREVTKQITAVDMLILSQGILTMDGRIPTAENIDNKLALHYYGRILFVQELLPLLRISPNGGKVLFILNGIDGNTDKINWDDMALENSYSVSAAKYHAITFTDLAIEHLASQLENSNVSFTHAFPGVVHTELADNLPFYIRIPFKGIMKLGFGVSAEVCAALMIHGMLKTDKGWRCVDGNGEIVKKKKATTDDMARKVWDHTSQIISKNH